MPGRQGPADRSRRWRGRRGLATGGTRQTTKTPDGVLPAAHATSRRFAHASACYRHTRLTRPACGRPFGPSPGGRRRPGTDALASGVGRAAKRAMAGRPGADDAPGDQPMKQIRCAGSSMRPTQPRGAARGFFGPSQEGRAGPVSLPDLRPRRQVSVRPQHAHERSIISGEDHSLRLDAAQHGGLQVRNECHGLAN